MKIENRVTALAPMQFRIVPAVLFLGTSLLLTVTGCGVPGEPVPPSPPIPTAVGDLTARQLGDGVLLSFTLPNKSTLGERLAQTPTLEVFSGALRADGTPDQKSFRQVDIVPASVLGGYVRQGKVEFLDAMSPDETRAHPGALVLYRVRTRVSERTSSADSNLARVNLYPVPERIGSVDVQVTEKSVQLKWAAPKQMSGGGALRSITEYHVYRGELDLASVANAEKDLPATVWKLPLLQIAAAKEPEFEDTGFDYGKTYVYVVRSVANEEGVTLESGDSRVAIVTPKDTFPPASPRDLIAAVLPGATAGSSTVDLSWSLNIETDLAGYRIYRSESEEVSGQELNTELLPTPAYRDNSAQSGRKYWYSVTAVDRAGNESSPSTAATVEIP
jgi:hypothetical protein